MDVRASWQEETVAVILACDEDHDSVDGSALVDGEHDRC